jgi:hypothetical protein
LREILLTFNAKGIQNHCVQYSIMSRRSVFMMVMTRTKLRSCSGVLMAFLVLTGQYSTRVISDIDLPVFPRLRLRKVQLMCRLQWSGSLVQSPPRCREC